jgi:hypothetical protein
MIKTHAVGVAARRLEASGHAPSEAAQAAAGRGVTPPSTTQDGGPHAAVAAAGAAITILDNLS